MNAATWIKAGTTIGLAATAGVLGVSLTSQPALALTGEGSGSQPNTVYLTGVVRDFKERTAPGGHPDFEKQPAGGFGMYMNNIASDLGSDGKPVFTGAGKKVSRQWTDSALRPICPTLYNPSLGDIAGTWGSADTGAISSAATFNQWFRDVPSVNMSKTLTLAFQKTTVAGKVSYVFDDKLDSQYISLGGFFPIEGQLFGNPGGTPNRNFHFTFELHTTFTYDSAANQIFKFIGDDDVWVFINGHKVIDLGGVHAAQNQIVDLNRLGLTSGQQYPLDFFFAERHRTQSNCRIETNLVLETAQVPTVSVAFD